MQALDILLYISSPTRAVIDYLKRPGGACAAIRIQRWNIGFLWGAVVAVLLSNLLFLYAGISIKPSPYSFHYIFLWLWPLSRCNELVYAFHNDTFQQLSPDPQRSTGLTILDRIKLLWRSYVEIAINFGFIHYLLPDSMYKEPFASPFQATYFSVITIATVGYGDIHPVHPVSQFFSMYEVFAGILLIIFAFAAYLSTPREVT